MHTLLSCLPMLSNVLFVPSPSLLKEVFPSVQHCLQKFSHVPWSSRLEAGFTICFPGKIEMTTPATCTSCFCPWYILCNLRKIITLTCDLNFVSQTLLNTLMWLLIWSSQLTLQKETITIVV